MAEDTRLAKPFEVIEYEGQEARRYPNGIIRSPKGYILHLPSDVARERERIRRAKGEERAQEGIMLATQSESPEEAVMKIVRARTHIAMNDKGRAGNDAAKLVLTAAGFLNERSVRVEGEVKHQAVLPELPQAFLDFIQKHQEREIVEGKVIDDSE
jgi:hypothetical protein